MSQTEEDKKEKEEKKRRQNKGAQETVTWELGGKTRVASTK